MGLGIRATILFPILLLYPGSSDAQKSVQGKDHLCLYDFHTILTNALRLHIFQWQSSIRKANM